MAHPGKSILLNGSWGVRGSDYIYHLLLWHKEMSELEVEKDVRS